MSHVVLLTADPERGLSGDQITDAIAQVGGVPRRLSDSAAEIPVDRPVMAAVDNADVNCLPAANRRKRLLIADMDSTMIPVECIDEIADYAGVRDEVVAITEPAMRGEMSFDEALIARVALMEGLPEKRLEDVWRERISLNSGARVLVQTMRANGAYAALVSGGFTYFTQRVAAAAGFDEHRANILEIANGALTGTVGRPILGREAKLDALNALMSMQGIVAADAMAVGDGANDLAMISAAGLGVAYHAKPIVAADADASIVHGDLTALLYLQGYAENEFSRG
ncbi:MAG: phosphoserine phosphatase SerB [Pseudomonadota bacterium]